MRITLQICRNEFLVGVTQNSLERAFGGLLHGSVDVGWRSLAIKDCCKIDNADGGNGYAECHAGEFPLQLWDDQAHCPSGTCAGRHNIEACCPRIAEILGCCIDGFLRIRVGVNSRQQAPLDAVCLVQHFGHWCQAIGGTGSIGNHVVFFGIVHAVVNAQHNCEVFIFCRSRDDHFLNAVTFVGNRFGGIGKEACALDNNLNTLAAPLNRGRILFSKNLDSVPIDKEVVSFVADVAFERAIVGVELQQMGICFGIGEIVQGNDLNIPVQTILLKNSAVGKATNATKAIDADTNGHGESPRVGRRFKRPLPQQCGWAATGWLRTIHRCVATAQSPYAFAGFLQEMIRHWGVYGTTLLVVLALPASAAQPPPAPQEQPAEDAPTENPPGFPPEFPRDLIPPDSGWLPRGARWLVTDSSDEVSDEELMRLSPVDPGLSSPLPRTRWLARNFLETVDPWRSHEPANIRDPGPDTANFPNSPYTLPRGWVYVETTPFTWTAATRNVQSAGWNWEYLVRIGVTDRVEFRVFSNGLTYSEPFGQSAAYTALAPLVLDTKIHLWGADDKNVLLPSAGLEFYVQTNWASPQLQAGTQPAATLLFSNELPWDVLLEWNVGIGATTNDLGNLTYQDIVQFAFTKSLTPDLQIFFQGYVNQAALPRYGQNTVLGWGFVRYFGSRTSLFGSYNSATDLAGPASVIQLGGAAAF